MSWGDSVGCDLCPKCGRGSMLGPRYGKNEYGFERLFYTCGVCGYRSEEATVDKAKPADDKRCPVCGLPKNSAPCQAAHP